MMTWPMRTNTNAKWQQHLVGSFLFIALALACSGCQTFSLTEGQWEKQRKGEMVDREVGTAVDFFGTLGYYGLAAGQITAKSLK